MIKRKPSQDDIAMADEALNGYEPFKIDEIDIDGELPKTRVAGANPNDALVRGLTGATPALLGFLFGASPLTAENQILDAKKFYEKGKPNKLVPIVDKVTGKPVYEDAGMAVGEEIYQKPNKLQDAINKQFASVLLKDTITDDVKMGFQKGTKFVDSNDNVLPSSYVRFVPDKTTSHNTAAGGKVTYKIDAIDGKVKPVINTPGIGDIMGQKDAPLLKEEAQARVSSAKKGKEILNKHDMDIVSSDEAINEIMTTKDPIVFATALGKIQRTAVGENRLSDDEAARYMGSDYKDIVTRGNEWFQGRGLGNIPDNLRESAINLAKYAKSKAIANRESAKGLYGETSGLSKRGVRTIKQTLGAPDKKPEPVGWKNKFKG